MALKACRECGNNVSSKAELCPHCGIKKPVPDSWIKILICLSLLAGIVAYCYSGFKKLDKKRGRSMESSAHVKVTESKRPSLSTRVKVTESKRPSLPEMKRRMLAMCKVKIAAAIQRAKEGGEKPSSDWLPNTIKWGRNKKWSKGDIMHLSQRVRFLDVWGRSWRYRFTCCMHKKTFKYDVTSLTDLNHNQTNHLGKCT